MSYEYIEDVSDQLAGEKRHTKIECRECDNEWWDIKSDGDTQ